MAAAAARRPLPSVFRASSSAPLVALCIAVAGGAIGCAALDGRATDARATAPSTLAAETRDWAPHADVGIPSHGADGPTHDAGAPARPGAASTGSRRIGVAAAGVALGTLLVAVARDAGVELELHATLPDPVTLALRPRPLVDVLGRLAAQVPFHWRLRDGVLVVHGDAPYTDSYAVDYLNLERTTRGSVGLATRVGSINAAGGAGGAGGEGIANSSETLVESVAEHRFWDSLARDVVELLGDRAGGGDTAGGSVDDPGSPGSPGSLGGPGSDVGGAADARWSINRDAGLITLRAPPRLHERLVRYLDALHASAQRQVLIEATVVEVALSDSFETGIDWQVLAAGLTGLSAAQVLGGQPLVTPASVGRTVPPAGLVSLVQRSGDGELRATLSLLETFGDVRILSRPRIIALNNQSSVLKVVDNRVYFTLSVERRVTEQSDEIVTGTEIHTVPVGLVMNVTPFIGADDEVMLNVRPTLSRILGFVDDPNPELALADVRNGVPEIQVREMESMLRVHSGDVAIIGGLMQEAVRDDERALPGLARLPLVGPLFSRRSRERTSTELLIVLRPTVMPAAARRGAAGEHPGERPGEHR